MNPGPSADDVVQAVLMSDVDAPRVIAHHPAPPAVLRTLVELAGCCHGAAMDGPDRCTCWTPVYDLEQAEPDTSSVAGLAPGPCADCAYRPDSPERAGSDRYALSDAGALDDLVTSGQPFWCHQGMRKPVGYRHPAGIVVDAVDDHYDPPQIDGVPYRADGTAADLCAGWTARRLRAMQP